MNKVHFSSKTSEWGTPQDFFDKMSRVYGPFDLDVCASSKNAKCPVYYTLEWGPSGLEADWNLVSKKAWMNPPYGREIKHWVKKAADEALKGVRIVALLPSRTDTRWFHDHIYTNPLCDITFLRGRLKFGGAANSAPFPSMIVLFGYTHEEIEKTKTGN